jgi:protein-S-isoprenylcysteine O-methyltransferase Ste14
MTVCGWLIFALWLALVGYWGLSSRAVKQSMDTRWIWWREIAVRLGFFALVVQLLQFAVLGNASPSTPLYAPNASLPVGLVGLLVCGLGIGLAILARAHLARTWGAPMASKENPELVTNGPYALVRHPIYGGMLLAMVGSAIGQSVLWLLPLIVYGPNFIRSARREEKLMVERFPDRYRAYMKRTKMLLPFVL